MFALLLRGFVQRKLRVVLTAIAIALGVALMAGTYILTDTINRSFSEIFHTADESKSVIVSPTENLGSQVRSETSPIDETMLARVRATPGVAQAAGQIFAPGTLLNAKRQRLTTGAAPGFIASEVPARFEAFTPVKGIRPTGAGGVAIDEATANRHSLKLGQQIIVAGSAVAQRYTIVGILRFAGGASFGGASVALLTPEQAQRMVGERGRYDQINVAAAHGVTPAALRTRIRALLPHTVAVRTGSEQAARDSQNLEENLSFLRTFLLVFAYVALVVGAFIIFNTITVTQRTRELGLLRTLGASRSQILRSVVGEGLLLGVVGAVLGLLGGILLAPALDGLFKVFGAELPDNGTVLETRTIVVSLLVGIVVTVLAGLAPAMRATRVPPLAAMREGVQIPPRPLPTRRTLTVRFLVGLVVVFALGAALGQGIGLVLVIVWSARAARLFARLRRGGERPARHYRVVPALAGAIGWLVSWRGITARLARENSVRQPGRTLVTAAALTVGLALVAFVAVLADGANATLDQAVDRSFAGNLIVDNSQTNSQAGIPAILAPALRTVHGVASVTPVAFTQGRRRGSSSNVSVTAVDPSSFEHAYRVEWKQGSSATLLGLGLTGTVLTEEYATKNHLKVGQTFSLLTPTNRYVPLTVLGIARDNAKLLGDLTITRALASAEFGQREDALNFVSYAPGFTDAQVQSAVNRLLRTYFPQAQSQTAAQFKHEQSKNLNRALALIYVLLALSVFVSLFGIVNTLILSIYERTRELGMMRAIGTSRRQIRQMIRYESIITSLIGGVLGLAVGVLGAVLVGALTLSSSGYVQAIPVRTLLVLLVVAALAGLAAAQLPARRAARLDVLGALSAE
jgi:putative ABC transport system permease protein